MQTAADVTSANRVGISIPDSFATPSSPSVTSLNFSSAVARVLAITALAVSLFAVRAGFAEESKVWAFGGSDFRLSVVRVPVSFSLFDGGGHQSFRYVAPETMLSLSIVREKEALANIRLSGARRFEQPRSLLTWAGVNAGYGQILSTETAITRGYNGAVFSPRASVFVRTSFTF